MKHFREVATYCENDCECFGEGESSSILGRKPKVNHRQPKRKKVMGDFEYLRRGRDMVTDTKLWIPECIIRPSIPQELESYY